MKVVLQNLTKKFPGRGKNKTDEVIAVNDFTFEIPDGKLIGLLGISGRTMSPICPRRAEGSVWSSRTMPFIRI